jgi:hypothetical protein
VILKRVPHLLNYDSKNILRISIPWIQDFAQANLGWNFRKAIGVAQKHPSH